ncbi:hypothetical protein PENSPDRAFT_739686 [Peniophora sp. CONT]|nr:hypothetical protein PENSPDRAFT_739686 [Peniophora sp. CONT]
MHLMTLVLKVFNPPPTFPFLGVSWTYLRVTSPDCTRILSLPFLEVERLQYLKGEVQKTFEALKISPDFDLQPDPAIVHQKFPISRLPDAGEGCNNQDVLNEASVNKDNNDLDGAPFSIFLARQNYFGGLNMPVVDVYYDISEVKSIRDPSLFYRDQRALYEIVERATNRMLQASAMAAADDQRSGPPLPSNDGNPATSRTSDWDSEQPPPQEQPFADGLSHSVTPRKRRGSSPPVVVKRQAMVDWN